MGMSRLEDSETIEQEVNLWLEKRAVPQENYQRLSDHQKNLIRGVCTGTQTLTYSERRDLYRRLNSPNTIAGRDSIDPVDKMADEELRTFFLRLTESQRKFWDDWGC